MLNHAALNKEHSQTKSNYSTVKVENGTITLDGTFLGELLHSDVYGQGLVVYAKENDSDILFPLD